MKNVFSSLTLAAVLLTGCTTNRAPQSDSSAQVKPFPFKIKTYPKVDLAKYVPASDSPSGQCYPKALARFGGWPEVKTGDEERCAWIDLGPFLGKKKVCARVPVAYQRKCEKVLIANICHPKLDEVKADIEECVKGALTATIVEAVIAGDISKAADTFEKTLQACLALKKVQRAQETRVTFNVNSQCDEWHPL